MRRHLPWPSAHTASRRPGSAIPPDYGCLQFFYRDHPQFAGVAGQAEVLDDRTLLLRFEPEAEQQGETPEDSLILGLLLDFLSRQALTADPGPLTYSEAMAAGDEELLAGVTVDAADERKGSACC